MGPKELVRELSELGIRDERVLAAVASVDRELFVPPEYRELAWEDRALPIGFGQTISQPYVVAFMASALELRGEERLLEIGTGSGYAAAVLSRLCAEVYTVEIIDRLFERAEKAIAASGAGNVEMRLGDGQRGWREAAPFDAVLVSAAAEQFPQSLVGQLMHGGRMVVPVGPRESQQLLLARRVEDGRAEVEAILPVRFVPLTGAGEPGWS